MPVHRGPNNFIKINSHEEFKQLVEGITDGKSKYGKADLKEIERLSYSEIDMCFVEFYAPFADTCLYTRSIWADYSRKYHTPQLKYYEVNVTQLPEIAKLFNINLSGISRQLPTVILFENGIETQRFPAINDEGKIGKVIKYDSAKLAEWFDLPTRYRETAKFN